MWILICLLIVQFYRKNLTTPSNKRVIWTLSNRQPICTGNLLEICGKSVPLLSWIVMIWFLGQHNFPIQNVQQTLVIWKISNIMAQSNGKMILPSKLNVWIIDEISYYGVSFSTNRKVHNLFFVIIAVYFKTSLWFVAGHFFQSIEKKEFKFILRIRYLVH